MERRLYVKLDKDELSDRKKGLEILHSAPQSNLGWRIILGEETKAFSRPLVSEAAENQVGAFIKLHKATDGHRPLGMAFIDIRMQSSG